MTLSALRQACEVLRLLRTPSLIQIWKRAQTPINRRGGVPIHESVLEVKRPFATELLFLHGSFVQ